MSSACGILGGRKGGRRVYRRKKGLRKGSLTLDTVVSQEILAVFPKNCDWESKEVTSPLNAPIVKRLRDFLKGTGNL